MVRNSAYKTASKLIKKGNLEGAKVGNQYIIIITNVSRMMFNYIKAEQEVRISSMYLDQVLTIESLSVYEI